MTNLPSTLSSTFRSIALPTHFLRQRFLHFGRFLDYVGTVRADSASKSSLPANRGPTPLFWTRLGPSVGAYPATIRFHSFARPDWWCWSHRRFHVAAPFRRNVRRSFFGDSYWSRSPHIWIACWVFRSRIRATIRPRSSRRGCAFRAYFRCRFYRW